MGDAEIDNNPPGNASAEASSRVGDQKSGDVGKNEKLNDGTAENTAPKNDSDYIALPTSELTAEVTNAGDNNTAGIQLGVNGCDVGDGLGGTAAQDASGNDLEEGDLEGGARKRGAVEGAVDDDDLYRSLRGFALDAINAVR